MDSKIEMSKPETNVIIVFDLSSLIKVVVSAVVIVPEVAVTVVSPVVPGV